MLRRVSASKLQLILKVVKLNFFAALLETQSRIRREIDAKAAEISSMKLSLQVDPFLELRAILIFAYFLA